MSAASHRVAPTTTGAGMSRPARLTVAALLALASLNSSASLTGGQRAHAQDLTGLARIDATNSAVTEEGDGIALRLSLSQGVPWRVFTLADPPRLVFDFREIDWAGLDGAALIGTERVADLRFGSYRPGWSRLVLTLTDPMPGLAQPHSRHRRSSTNLYPVAKKSQQRPQREMPKQFEIQFEAGR